MNVKKNFEVVCERYLKLISFFWQGHYALLYGIAFLLGSYAAIVSTIVLIVPMFALMLPLCNFKLLSTDRRRYAIACIIVCVAFAYSHTKHMAPIFETLAGKQSSTSIHGHAVFSIAKLQEVNFYGKQWRYQGKVSFFDDAGDQVAKNISCSLCIPQELDRPKANVDYAFSGSIKNSLSSSIRLVPDKDSPWISIPWAYSLAELRFHAQEAFASYIRSEFLDSRTANFLTAISTGNFQDRLMKFEFSRFGLQHIMAISGFHFAILAALLAFLLTQVFSKKLSAALIIVLMTLYYLFLGASAAVMRAWISSMIVLCSCLVYRKGAALNSLGIGILSVLAYDPELCCSLGFQFSFAATAAILLLFAPCDAIMQVVFPKRSLSDALEMDLWNRFGYVILSFFRQAFALGFAVNLVALPLTLFHFQTFPLISIFYNLFFPFLVSISLALLILGALVSFVLPPLSALLNAMNATFTYYTLQYTHQMPPALDLQINADAFPLELVVIGYTILFLMGAIYAASKRACGIDGSGWCF